MKRIMLLIFSLLMLLSQTGCWDLALLKDARLLVIVGLDRTPEGKLLTTTAIREVRITEGGAEPTNVILKTTGRTPRETRDNGDRRINNRFDPSKNRTLVLGEQLAREDIYPVLDIFFRDPKSALNAHFAVVKGRAEGLVDLKKVGDTLIGEYVDEVISSAEKTTLVPQVNIKSVSPMMFDPGQDFAVPYLTTEVGDLQAAGIDNEKDVSVEGIAMFHGRHMTGTLNRLESRLFLLMANKKNQIARLIMQVDPGETGDVDSYITIDIRHIKRALDVQVRPDGTIRADLNLELDVAAIEYPKDELMEQPVVERLNKKISQSLTHQATQVIKKMQRSRFDGFGIGRRIMAHYPEEWQGAKWWTKTYPKITLRPQIKVQIIGHGILG
ncbi:Ger(x)C family spore germination protein [Desmospora profundinema]|uniref:Ger(X)C family germination protein n=1 Tax=Desmospora profundinema TaxID=1571184 RepID=A0ABU1IHU7_9BACL|nr:Ger(x)C family spore germination protein [Desmospora profundinema]MDR6224345.1 Ger(x)C family germination protein [Desmospora profundinema]